MVADSVLRNVAGGVSMAACALVVGWWFICWFIRVYFIYLEGVEFVTDAGIHSMKPVTYEYYSY